MKIKLFVYGSLKKGFYNHSWLEDVKAEYVCIGKTEPIFEMVSVCEDYPALLSGNKSILGEVYSIDKEKLSHIDIIEGYPNYYCRKKVQVSTKNGTEECYIYYIDEPKETYVYADVSEFIEKLKDGSYIWLNQSKEDF